MSSCIVDSVKGSSSTENVPPISRPGGKLPTDDASVLTIRQILKYSLSLLLTVNHLYYN